VEEVDQAASNQVEREGPCNSCALTAHNCRDERTICMNESGLTRIRLMAELPNSSNTVHRVWRSAMLSLAICVADAMARRITASL